MRKLVVFMCENKVADQLHGIRAFNHRLCFCCIVQSLYFPKPKFKASSHHMWPCNAACVGLGRNPDDKVSRDAARTL